jgi:hypothetical protein
MSSRSLAGRMIPIIDIAMFASTGNKCVACLLRSRHNRHGRIDFLLKNTLVSIPFTSHKIEIF